MAVKIRLRRMGKRNAACHRIVVADGRSPRDGRFIESIGTYDPRHKVEQIDLERVEYWLPRGAQPSETVRAIIKRARAGISMNGIKPEAQAQTAETATVTDKAPAADSDAQTETETTAAGADSEPEDKE